MPIASEIFILIDKDNLIIVDNETLVKLNENLKEDNKIRWIKK